MSPTVKLDMSIRVYNTVRSMYVGLVVTSAGELVVAADELVVISVELVVTPVQLRDVCYFLRTGCIEPGSPTIDPMME